MRPHELLLTLLTPVAIGACSAPERNALPEELVEEASPVGMPGVRYWGDVQTPEFVSAAFESVEREFAILAQEEGEPVPTANFLALSGGGANGAFGAGLLCGWSAAGDRPEFKLVTGISTGALMAPFAFLGTEADAALRELYTTTGTEDILKLGGVFRLLFGESAGDSAPLAQLLARVIDDEILTRVAEEHRRGRLLLISTTNLDAGRPVIWDMGKIAASGSPRAPDLFRAVMMASASIPGVFPPVMMAVEAGGERYDEMHVDGGAAAQVFLYPEAMSIKELSEGTNFERERRAFIVRNSKLATDYSATERKIIAISGRSITQLIRSQGIGDLYRIYTECLEDGIEYNLAYVPDTFDFEANETFDPDYMRALFAVGERLGREGYPWLRQPPGFEAEPAAPPAPSAP